MGVDGPYTSHILETLISNIDVWLATRSKGASRFKGCLSQAWHHGIVPVFKPS
jgi:hypothetical protein